MKIKTNKAAKKRFRVASSGRIKRKQAYLRHNMRRRSPAAKRKLGKKTMVSSADMPLIVRLLPNG